MPTTSGMAAARRPRKNRARARRADADAYRQELRAIVDKLEGREDAAYGRATAIYGLRHTEAGIAWADDMIKALGDRADQVALEP